MNIHETYAQYAGYGGSVAGLLTLADLLTPNRGHIDVTFGQHILEIKTCGQPSEVYLRIVGNDPDHCGGGNAVDLAGVVIGADGFEIECDIKSGTATIFYLWK